MSQSLKTHVVEVAPKFNLGVYEAYVGAPIRGPADISNSIFKEIKHPLYNIDQFALEPIMFCYFTSKDQRLPQDVNAPDVYYLPIFLGLICFSRNEEQDLALFREAVELIISISKSEPSKTFVLPLSRIYRYFYLWPWQLKLPDNVIILTIENYLPHPNVICVPYPSDFHYNSESEVAQRLRSKLSSVKEKTACFFGRKRRDDHFRSQIISVIEASKLTKSISNFDSSGRKHRLSDGVVEGLSTLRLNSWLSIEPPGDSPSRKGIFDALLGLSLPLLFESGRYDFPFSNYFPWYDTCLFIKSADEWRLMTNKKSLDEIILETSEQEIKDRIVLLSKYVRLLQYTPPHKREPNTKDAFFATEIEIGSLMKKRIAYATTSKVDV